VELNELDRLTENGPAYDAKQKRSSSESVGELGTLERLIILKEIAGKLGLSLACFVILTNRQIKNRFVSKIYGRVLAQEVCRVHDIARVLSF
jgi:hypothetical protein